MRARATVAGLTSSAAPMAASVQPGPAWPWLAFSRMRAWVRALAGATPRPIMVCSRARSCSDRTTTCRLRTPGPPAAAGFPGPQEHETQPHIPQITTDELLGLGDGLAVEVALGFGPDTLADQLAGLAGLEVAVVEVDAAVLAGDPGLVSRGGEGLPGQRHRGSWHPTLAVRWW